jgi:oligopeptide/dipeptide ABC transporter ATP-binding protein
MALACEPKLLVADEPTTALDVTIQAQILDLLRQLRAQLGMATLLITHNMGVVAEIADRVAVMYAGEIVESGTAHEVLRTPLHPYTQGLLRSLPRLGVPDQPLASIPGTVPRPGNMPQGCRFAPRCAFCRPECTAARPTLRVIGTKHTVRCPFAETLPQRAANVMASASQEPAGPRTE